MSEVKVTTIGDFIQFLLKFPPETKIEFLDPDTGWEIKEWNFELNDGLGIFSAEYDGEMITSHSV